MLIKKLFSTPPLEKILAMPQAKLHYSQPRKGLMKNLSFFVSLFFINKITTEIC